MTDPTPAPVPEPTPAAAVPAAPASAGAPVPPPPGTDYPGKTLGIVGVVLAILGFFSYGVLAIVGLILGVVARGQSKAAGYTNGPAKVAIILGVIALVIGLIIGIIFAIVIGGVVSQCAGLGPGVHEVNGVTFTCG